MQPGPLTELLDESARIYRETDPTGWTAEECEQLLDGLQTVSYEISGLADRVRAWCVNNTPVPHPVKPYTPPPPPPPEPKDHNPPAPPPVQPGNPPDDGPAPQPKGQG